MASRSTPHALCATSSAISKERSGSISVQPVSRIIAKRALRIGWPPRLRDGPPGQAQRSKIREDMARIGPHRPAAARSGPQRQGVCEQAANPFHQEDDQCEQERRS